MISDYIKQLHSSKDTDKNKKTDHLSSQSIINEDVRPEKIIESIMRSPKANCNW